MRAPLCPCPDCQKWLTQFEDRVDAMGAHGQSKLIDGAMYALSSFRQMHAVPTPDFGVPAAVGIAMTISAEGGK